MTPNIIQKSQTYGLNLDEFLCILWKKSEFFEEIIWKQIRTYSTSSIFDYQPTIRTTHLAWFLFDTLSDDVRLFLQKNAFYEGSIQEAFPPFKKYEKYLLIYEPFWRDSS